jgi:hypothetical protein
MTVATIVLAVLILAAEVVLWAIARAANFYGKTADGALLAAAIGWAAFVFLPADEVAFWGLILAVVATVCLYAMASNKGEKL